MSYEDFTTYTEVDPNSRFSQTITRNSFTNLQVDENAYVYKDYGVSYFDDFTHDIDIRFTAGWNDIKVGVWSITDTPAKLESLTEGLVVNAIYNIGGLKLQLQEIGGSIDWSSGLSFHTNYYLRITRNDTSITCKIYPSFNDRTNDTNLFDTLNIACSTDTYRYLMCGFSQGSGSSGRYLTGYTENYDLNPDISLLINGSFETWTVPGTAGSSDGTCSNWTTESVNSGTATRGIGIPNGTNFGNYCLHLRSNSSGDTDSIGAIKSDSFTLNEDYIYFWQLSQNTNVNFKVELLNNSDVVLATFYPTIVTGWTLQRISVSAYKTQNVKVKFSQNTTESGFGYYTKVDYVEQKENAGTFQNAGFENWIDSNNPEYWERYIVNSGIAQRVADPNSGIYASKIRAGVSGAVDSIGGFTSHPLYLQNATLKWYQKSENINVAFTISLLDRNYNILTSISPSISVGSYTQQQLDVSSYAGQDVCIRIEQHTTLAPFGYYTHIDDVSLEGTVPLTANLFDTVTLSDIIELSLSLEKTEKAESITLSDEIHVAFSKQQELSDTVALSDDIDIMLSKSLSDTLALSDAITISTVEPSVNDFNNIFGMVNGIIKDVNNKFGMFAESKSDINNKVGFLKSWQVPGDAGYQSLGKTYIKVYINSVEQTDVDVDSITISKVLNSPHTASFILGRPYDNTKPSIELPVEIKYHIWTLYKGYITQITPTDSPDTIRINCQDKYWKQNKTKKYFSIGHKPTDNQELYYNTISEGLSACGASFGIGGFIPQTMSLFGIGESDAISNLVSNSGNFGWYYDVAGTKKLWTAGQGDIIYLEKQELGTNLRLHQILRHSFRESIERIVNKFRVQMGDLVWRRFNDTGGVKEYAGQRWSQYLGSIFPKWNAFYERLATKDYNPAYIASTDAEIAKYGKGGTVPQKGTSGVFRHSVDENESYKDVFVKYDLPYLNRDLESWTDKSSPQIIIDFPLFGGWKLSGSLRAPKKPWFREWGFRYRISEGFTIDYEKGEVTFNEPVYLYQSNAKGDITKIKKAQLEIAIYKEQYYSDTEDPSDDPEGDISNPLMFFTEKCGDYPEIIIENLTLSGLGIQIGGWEIVGRTDDNRPIYRYTPSWNDTAFAVDLANWRLTQNCDKKISGTAEVAIDTVCFYDINLSNRIMIEGVIEDPLNITSISYNIGSWRVSLGLENGRYFKRSVSIQSHGE